ncbi:hypothetical protein [Williamsia phyllosphaerae]|uniref:Uncharacterized protein n=1 Tax=Williamsia phyllosphaerae TaxID=885042 RepID=A0ABQ1V9Q3_9NOCA|nr:hypothetical protein [Williamsia phyllosphaerae]GGF43904.1 hypothetical protein GCM10007298_44600 [Williamsia phyllosphaerae]
MSRRTIFVLRAVGAGALVACGIGLGANNGWLMALIVGVPLIVSGFVVAPRPSRVSELPVWSQARPGVEAQVGALTRSTLGDVDRQPCLITATVSPADDIPYEARWLASMTRSDVTALLDAPHVELPDSVVPPREPTTPEFDDVPGRRALMYPAATVAVLIALLVLVPASMWRVDVSADSSSRSGGGSTGRVSTGQLASAMEHARTLSPTAAGNILQISLAAGGSDRINVFLPDTGQIVSAYRSSGSWRDQPPAETRLRGADAFPLTDLDPFDLDAVSAAMTGDGERLLNLEIKRTAPEEIPLATAKVGPDVFDQRTVQARLTGEVAESFDPGDLAVSMRIAADAIRAAKLPTSAPVLTRFEIRGTREGTPIMRAGSIQNSGGVLIEYSTETTTGSVVVRPGEFPSMPSPPYENKAGRLPRGAAAFDQLSAATFARIRDDAMRRGGVAAFDRTAVDLQVTQGRSDDDYGPVVYAAVGPSPGSEGTYGLDGAFLRAQLY